MKRISSSEEEKVIEMWFDGYTREYIATTLGIGETTVSDIIATLPQSLRLARDIAVAHRKHNLAMADAVKGLGVIIQLDDIDVKPEQIPSFVQTVKKMCTDAQYQPSYVIQAAMKLSNIEVESGKTYPAAIAEFQTALKSKKELDKQNQERTEENSQLKLEIEENRRVRDQTLEKAKTTPQEISEFQQCKTALHEYRLKIDDAKTMRTVFDGIKECGGNPRLIVSLFKEHGSLKRLVDYFARQLRIKQDELFERMSVIKESRQLISQLKEEERQRQVNIDWQKRAWNSNNYQLSRVSANTAELESRRQAMITWIGKQLGLSHEEIDKLRLESEFDMMLAAIDNKLKDALASRYDAFRATYF